MCEHSHVIDATATPQPGYAIHYVEVCSFDITIASQSGYLILQIHHNFTPEEKERFSALPNGDQLWYNTFREGP